MKLVTYTPKQRRRAPQMVSVSVAAVRTRTADDTRAVLYVSRDAMADADREGHFALTLTLSTDEVKQLIARLERALAPVDGAASEQS